jgi:hypothetical protein
MIEKLKSAFLCLALAHLCFASAIPRNSRQVAPNASVADPDPQVLPSPESCLSKINQLTDRVYREARESGREVDLETVGSSFVVEDDQTEGNQFAILRWPA